MTELSKEILAIMNEKLHICPYCRKGARWVSEHKIFGVNRHGDYYWWCEPCGAYTRCRDNTKHPIGTMADKKLRSERGKIKSIIDRYLVPGGPTKFEVYSRLKTKMGFSCAIGSLTIDKCERLLYEIPRILGEIRDRKSVV